MDSDLASIHACLCADGYVIKNPKDQKSKYYHIGFRNTNPVLLKDFQIKFLRVFKLKPHIYRNRCRIGSKEIYYLLTRKSGSFYSKDWVLPDLKKVFLRHWLRSYFDCEAWVTVRARQNRSIGLDSINGKGLLQIQGALSRFDIKSSIKKRSNRNIFTLTIFGKENLLRFQKEINFLHPAKKEKLINAIKSYMDYRWLTISKEVIKQKAKIKKPFIIRIVSKLKENLIKTQNFLNKYKIESKIYSRRNGQGTPYYSLRIQKKSSIKRAIKKDLIAKEQISKIDSKLYK